MIDIERVNILRTEIEVMWNNFLDLKQKLQDASCCLDDFEEEFRDYHEHLVDVLEGVE